MDDMILVSACLVGEKCRYDAKVRIYPGICRLRKEGKAVIVCPEVMGGLPSPRLSCEIVGGDGKDVLEGRAKVINSEGADVTKTVIAGAYAALEQAKEFGVKLAVLKARSPACGSGHIYDGTFQGALIKGNGILAELLKREGIKVISEEDYALEGKNSDE